MATRIKWDQYETALLIETFWKIEKSPDEKKRLISELSQKLRQKAQNAGIDIDELFRNENGISMQLAPIAHAFFPERPTLTSSAMFERMVQMYKDDREGFEIVLSEANKMVNIDYDKGASGKEAFGRWIDRNEAALNIKEDIFEAIELCSNYCLKKNIVRKSFWDIKDEKELYSAGCKLLAMKAFKILHKKASTLFFSKAFPLYRQYLKEEQNDMPDKLNQIERITEEQNGQEATFISGNDNSNSISNENTDNNRDDWNQTSTDSTGVCENDPEANKLIAEVLQNSYPYGFNLLSPIEALRFRKKYFEVTGKEIQYSDNRLLGEIYKNGILFDGKVYVVTEETILRLEETIQTLVQKGLVIFYYSEIYDKNESWLFDGKVVSVEMLKTVLETRQPDYQYKANYLIACGESYNEKEALISDLNTVWGDFTLRSFTELSELLPYVPLTKIKYALTSGNQFVWNSFETYTRKDYFNCNDDQLAALRYSAAKLCSDKGSATFEELPVEDIIAENYELSETAIIDIIFSLLSDEFDRNRKALTRKGEKISINDAIANYCRDREECSFEEVEQFSKETVGEVRYPVIVEAINRTMIRVDSERFVADNMVSFDIESIDNALDGILKGNVIGMKEITTFGAFPYCGYQWNLFLLESYCRRFSRKFRYDCATANSKNAGAIIRAEFAGNYHAAMAEAVACSDTDLNVKDVFDYLISSGLMLKRQYSEIEDLIRKATLLRKER